MRSEKPANRSSAANKARAGDLSTRITTMEGFPAGRSNARPLQRLLEDIRQKLIDVVVVYKVDRLTRSLSDFAKIVEIFDGHGISFVAVTQQFNTTTSMGRLTLNVLLSFAQFEREVTGERIRDKIAASKRKGMWVGGLVPLGYEVRDRQLVIQPSETETVRKIFQRYCELGNVRLLKNELDRTGVRSKIRVAGNGKRSGGESFSRGALYTLLKNPIYIGEVRHKGTRHPGLHEPIIERAIWKRADELLHAHAGRARGTGTKSMQSPLVGRLFDESGRSLTPSHAVKGTRRYRYYVSRSLITRTAAQTERGWRIPAAEFERHVAAGARLILKDRVGIAADVEHLDCDALQVKSIFEAASAWSEWLGSEADAAESLRLLVERVELAEDGIKITLQLPVGPPGKTADAVRHLKLTRLIPMQMRRRGVEIKFVIGGDSVVSRGTDPALVKLIGRARCWFNDLISGRAASMDAIGKRDKVGKRYVSRIIRFAFLAPSIVEDVVGGRHRADFTAESLLRNRRELPPSWDAQHKLLGFSQPY
jgi:DNA invertase Pin-like site-specific DNA recombinase